MTLEQVQKVLLLEQREDISDLALRMHTIAILTGEPADRVARIRQGEIDRVYRECMKAVTDTATVPLQRFVKILGREYAFIEDVRDMETGAFIDLDEMSKEGAYAANLHKIMAVLYRPIEKRLGDDYQLRSYVTERLRLKEERQAIFLKHMTYDIVRGAVGFFLHGGLMLSATSSVSWHSQQVRQSLLLRYGDGTTLFTASQEEQRSTLTAS